MTVTQNNKMCCVDFDDLCDAVMVQQYKGKDVELVEFLGQWKTKVPALKVTLFAIPKKCSPDTISKVRELGEWVALAPHGWRHSRGECLAWTMEEALDKIGLATKMGIDAPCFRAPGWLIDQDTYDACKSLNYTVCSHETFRIPNTKVKEYVYNLHMGASPPRVQRVHGHLTPVSGNWIYDMGDRGFLPYDNKITYYWPWEVGKII